MREIDRHSKNQKRGRRDPDKYDRPKAPSHNRHDYLMSLGVGVDGNGNMKFPLFQGNRYLDGDHGSLGGLSDDYVWRLFEWERSQQRRRGYTSLFKHVRGREARDRLEFEDWLRWHPQRERLEAFMARDHNRGWVGPNDHI